MMIQGNMWGVARNEDGDESGWGSRTFFADKADLSSWQFVSPESDPWIYESPKMFRHGSELYLVARTDPGGPFWSKDNPLLNVLPAWQHHLADLVSFSLRGHGTAIWRLDTASGGLEMVLELAGCGDTAFPSIVRSQLSYTNIYFLISNIFFSNYYLSLSESDRSKNCSKGMSFVELSRMIPSSHLSQSEQSDELTEEVKYSS